MSLNIRGPIGLLTGVFCAFGAVLPAAAQEGAPQDRAPPPRPRVAAVEEIVVTAEKREASIQDVPIAVSAFSQESLEERQITGASDLAQVVPNLIFSKTNFTSSNLSIRGVGSASVAASGSSGVGVHTNGVPLQGNRLFEAEFFDVERVEILRGPQGTLYGRNATGGVFNVITARPTEDLSAELSVTGTNYGGVTAKGWYNVPLGEDGEIGGFRVAGIYTHRDGFTQNLATGNDIDGRDLYALRGTLELNPTPNTRATAIVSYFREDDDRARIQKRLCTEDPDPFPFNQGCLSTGLDFGVGNSTASAAGLFAFAPPILLASSFGAAGFQIPALTPPGTNLFAGAVNPPDLRVVNAPTDPQYFADEFLATLELEHDFGKIKVTSLTAYQNTEVDSISDFTFNSATIPFLPNQSVGIPVPGVGIVPVPLTDVNGVFGIPGFIQGVDPDLTFGPTAFLQAFDRSQGRSEQVSTELRFASDFDGPLNFNVGGIYIRQTGDADYRVVSNGLEFFGVVADILANAAAGRLPFDPLTGQPNPAFVSSFDQYSFFSDTDDSSSLDAYAAFGEVYWNLTDNLKVTGGIRYTNDNIFVRDRSTFLNIPPIAPAPPAFREQSVNFSEVTGRAAIDWKTRLPFTDESLVYAAYSRGYKAGGVNPPVDLSIVQSVPPQFQPEFVNSVEVGAKNVLADGRLIANITGFFYDYTNYQISRIQARTAINDNIDARVYGLEFESIFEPIDRLRFNVNLGYLRSRITDEEQIIDPINLEGGLPGFTTIADITNSENCIAPSASVNALLAGQIPGIDAATGAQLAPFICSYSFIAPGGTENPQNRILFQTIFDALGGTAPGATPEQILAAQTGALQVVGAIPVSFGNPQSIEGNRLPAAPAITLSLGAEYTWLLPKEWEMTLRGDYTYQSSSFGRIFNAPVDQIDSYDQLNFRLRFYQPERQLELSMFVNNALNDDNITGLFQQGANAGLFTNAFINEPRVFGGTVAKRF